MEAKPLEKKALMLPGSLTRATHLLSPCSLSVQKRDWRAGLDDLRVPSSPDYLPLSSVGAIPVALVLPAINPSQVLTEHSPVARHEVESRDKIEYRPWLLGRDEWRNKNEHLLSTYPVPGSVLNSLHLLTPFPLTITS